MGIPGSANPLLLATQDTGYRVQRSLRFNSSDSAYLNRTPSSAGNRKTWTWAGWVKRSTLGQKVLFSAAPSNQTVLWFEANGSLEWTYYTTGYVARLQSAAVYRDMSAWYHIVCAVDTTNPTADDRVKLYVNGVQLTSFALRTNPSLNAEYDINNNVAHRICSNSLVPSAFFDGYLADIHFIDGQALTPSSFTEVSATTGQLIPKAYTGTYGTNGFRLDFADNSAATAAALGKDTSGNGNNFTPNNLSVTAGAGNDSLVDTPTSYGTDTGVGGEVRGNYATLNPLDSGSIALANGNLDATFSSGSGWNTSRATIWVSSGKWYWETTVGTVTSGQPVTVGIAQSTLATSSYIGGNAGSYGYYAGGKRNNGTDSAYGASFTTGDVIGTALDLDAGTITFYKNGVSQGQAFSGLSGTFAPGISLFVGQTSSATVCNFGQRPFAYTAPSGFKALCTANLPTPTIANPATVFDTKLYTGNGSTQTISGLGFSPDLVWIKKRNSASNSNHLLADTVRGVSTFLSSSGTFAESTFDAAWRSNWGDLTAFNSDGFTVVAGSSSNDNINDSPNTHVAWCWDAGSSTVTNTQGSITSQVRANASAGFSVVTWTGTGATGTVGHGLGVAPQLVIYKNRDSAQNWVVLTTALDGSYDYVFLNTTDAGGDAGGSAPTSTVLNLVNASDTNGNGNKMLAYCFASVDSYSRFGGFTGTGNADGPAIWCGFRPALLMIKRIKTSGNWIILDTKRLGYNVDNNSLYGNLANAEGATDLVDILSNGFKIRSTDGDVNASTAQYLFYAWAESPFAYARAR